MKTDKILNRLKMPLYAAYFGSDGDIDSVIPIARALGLLPSVSLPRWVEIARCFADRKSGLRKSKQANGENLDRILTRAIRNLLEKVIACQKLPGEVADWPLARLLETIEQHAFGKPEWRDLLEDARAYYSRAVSAPREKSWYSIMKLMELAGAATRESNTTKEANHA